MSTVRLRNLVDYMEASIRSGSRYEATLPDRYHILRENPFGVFGSLAAFCPEQRLFVVKTVSYVESEKTSGAGVDGAVVVLSSETGQLLAVLDAPAITMLKSAAATALVTDWCAPTDAAAFGIVGTGAQARAQAMGVGLVRAVSDVRVYSRNEANRRRFVDECSSCFQGSATIEPVNSSASAMEGRDILSTASSSNSPFEFPGTLSNAIHINCVGAHSPLSREISKEVFEVSTIIVEDRANAIEELGEQHQHAIELYELTQFASQSLKASRTVFSSIGHAYLDLITAAFALSELGILVP